MAKRTRSSRSSAGWPQDGITIVIIEHTMQAMVRLVDRFVVLDHGAVLVEGKPEAVTRDPRVIEAYLGKKWSGHARLERRHRRLFRGLPVLNGVSIRSTRASSSPIVGPNGAGKTTLFKAISGTLQPMSGAISFEDTDLAAVPPHRRAASRHRPCARKAARSSRR